MFAIYICSFLNSSLSLFLYSFFSFRKTQTYTCLTFCRRQVQLKCELTTGGISYFECVSFEPVEGGIRVIKEHPRKLLIMSPFEMLRHGRAIRPPPSVTILPLPHDHRVSVLLPLGTHSPPLPSPLPPRVDCARPFSLVPSLWNFTRTRDTHSQRSGSVGTFSSFPTVTVTVVRLCLVVAN